MVQRSWFVQTGLTLGFFCGSVATARAEGASWSEPQVVLSIVGIVFAAGIAYQLISDTRHRLTSIERTFVSKDTVEQMTARLDRIEAKLDQLVLMKNR
jgi:hypothetical protein